MISGITKKVIFPIILFINFLQPSKSAVFEKIHKNNTKQDTKDNLSSFVKFSDDNYPYLNLLQENPGLFLAVKA